VRDCVDSLQRVSRSNMPFPVSRGFSLQETPKQCTKWSREKVKFEYQEN
jgi:hypothetical protein